MRNILIAVYCIIGVSIFGQSEMKTPKKTTTINNAGNPIRPIQKSNMNKSESAVIHITKKEFEKLPKKKQKLIKKEPEKYLIID